jgi:8-oxo-dGTP pyrophosphatase MutT (NUDIX family)
MSPTGRDTTAMFRRVAAHVPTTRSPGRRGFRAATALIVADAAVTPRLLVIRRASRDSDPWSGHAALPGGRHETGDDSLAATARRETAEEVGVDLPSPVGRLDDVGGRTGVVATFVFRLDAVVATMPEPSEVAEAIWTPLDVLTDPAARVRHPHRTVGPWPAWEHQGLVIWGLTHRILSGFVAVAGLARD